MISQKKTLLVALIITFLSMALASAAQAPRANANGGPKQEPSAPPVQSTSRITTGADYVIGPDDMLSVNVWKEPDLTRSVLVRPDGKITLPLLRDVQAAGMTPGQLQATLEKGLADYISKPAVTVIVQEARSHRFNIIGQVQKPGSYSLTTPLTVLDAIALAGGFREWAKTGSIYVLRETSTGNREKITFNYKKVVKGEDKDVPLQIKDTVVVP